SHQIAGVPVIIYEKNTTRHFLTHPTPCRGHWNAPSKQLFGPIADGYALQPAYPEMPYFPGKLIYKYLRRLLPFCTPIKGEAMRETCRSSGNSLMIARIYKFSGAALNFDHPKTLACGTDNIVMKQSDALDLYLYLIPFFQKDGRLKISANAR